MLVGSNLMCLVAEPESNSAGVLFLWPGYDFPMPPDLGW